MQDNNRVIIERYPWGCGLIIGLVLLGWLGVPSLYDGITKGGSGSIAIGAIASLLAAYSICYRGGLDFDTVRRKLIRWRKGLWPKEKEFDLDDCSVRVKTVNDSGIWHAVSLECADKPLSTKRSRGRDGFKEIREKARAWAELMKLPVYETSAGRPLQRNPDELLVPLLERLKTSGEAFSSPPPNEAIPVSHVDGKMVFDLSKSRQKVLLSSDGITIETNIFVTTIRSTINAAEIMELERYSTAAARANALTLVTPEDLKSIAPGYDEADLEWLRNAILYSLLNLSNV
ncbi:MAG TPA: hypothetical protein VEK08_21150 [Planctomycetota bacterium]|nr:hypothetical protein [Planctomycetota bacterium]